MITPDPVHRAQLEKLSRLLEGTLVDGADDEADIDMYVVLDAPAPGTDGMREERERVELPREAIQGLLQITRALAQNLSLEVVPEGAELTTQAAADLLGVSRPHLIALIDRGELAAHMVGTHRRLQSDDVLAYRARRNRERRARVREHQRRSAAAEGLPAG